ncbi:hypothetical protein [Flavobacterium cerinum]|nr:hypothetical protein [Flavobacterium cerinum]
MSQLAEHLWQQKQDAKEALRKAKEQEAQKLQSGAKLKRVNTKTFKIA